MPSLVRGLSSSSLHMTSCFTPPTLRVTLGQSRLWAAITSALGSSHSQSFSSCSWVGQITVRINQPAYPGCALWSGDRLPLSLHHLTGAQSLTLPDTSTPVTSHSVAVAIPPRHPPPTHTMSRPFFLCSLSQESKEVSTQEFYATMRIKTHYRYLIPV